MPNKTALIIESDSAFANHLSDALSPLGFTSEILSDGADGLAHAKDFPPSLIVLCVELPKMSGYAVCNKLKKSTRLKDVPLLIMSSEATPETFEQHRKLKTRADEYILKGADFSIDDFLKKVQAILPQGQDEEALDEIPLDEGIDLAFDEEHTGVDSELLEETSAALSNLGAKDEKGSSAEDQLGAEEDFDLNFNDAAEMTQDAVVEEEIIGDPAPPREDTESPVEEEVVGGLDLGLEEVADSAAAEAAQPATAPAPAPAALDLKELNALRQERDQLLSELNSLKSAPAAKSSSGDRDREFLNLRGVINKKEKEVLDLKDQLMAKDREILDGRDRITLLERAKQDLDSQNLDLEGARVELNERIAALEADKQGALAKVGALEGLLREKEALLADKEKALTQKEDHLLELEARGAAELKAAKEELEGTRSAHAEELASLKNRHAGETLRLKEEHEAALSAQKEANDSRVAALEREHAGSISSLKSSHETAMGSLRAEHEARIAALEAEHRDALAHKAEEAAAALEEAEARRESALAALEDRKSKAEEELRSGHQADLDALKGAHQSDLQRLRDEHAAATDALRVSHGGELERLRDEHAAATDALKVSHDGEMKALRSQNQGAMDELRGQHAGKVSALESRIAELEKAKQEVEEQNRALAADLKEQGSQISAAVDKIQTDGAVVANIKKALVVALTLLEEQFQDTEEG
ncbi:MAG: response regulator [Polyangia bacterium]|jgi:DNA-binding response OmpR family regulator|nr:response regulator [Polyangia bacterium]